MLREVVGNFTRKLGNALAPRPSKELEDFNGNVLTGNDPRIPVYGKQADEIEIECYGNQKGEEKERIRLLWGKSEKSYFVTRKPGENISVFFEGFYPRR